MFVWVCRCRRGFCRVLRFVIYILVGLKVCIYVIRLIIEFLVFVLRIVW